VIYFYLKQQKKEKRLTWAVPFYNRENENLDFLVVNTFSKDPISIKLIVNSKIYNFDNLTEYAWSLCTLGSINLDYEIIIYYDGKIKNVININDENREEFKKLSHSTTKK
jgi:cellulose synthase/poly-beta-1,6-N-acetylglucosamine synthase-like glycosyltransferase